MSALHTYRLDWQGIGMTITHAQNQWGIIDHIEIHTDGKRPIPITETGYRSHFLSGQLVKPYGTANAFVKAWLDEEASNSDWQQQQDAQRQLSLF